MTSKIGFYRFLSGHISNENLDIFPMKIYNVVTDVVNDVTYSRKSVITLVVIRFYDMTLSTGKQWRHMIRVIRTFSSIIYGMSIRTLK